MSQSISVAPIKPPQVLPECVIKIGGVAIPEQSFRWGFPAGIAPYRGSFRVPYGLVSQIEKISNPTTIDLNIKGTILAKRADLALQVKNLYIEEIKGDDLSHFLVVISDRRSRLRGQKVTISANITRKENRFAEGQKGTTKEVGTAKLREEMDRYSIYRYDDWSINGTRTWTAYQLLKDALKQIGISRISGGVDNGFVTENIVFEEEDATTVIPQLLAWSRLNIGLDASGNYYLFSADDTPNSIAGLVPNSPLLGQSTLYKQDLSRVRPSVVTVQYRKKQEVFVRAMALENQGLSTTTGPFSVPIWTEKGITQQHKNEGRVVGCINVIKIPYDIQINGEWRQRGTYCDIKEYFTAIKMNENTVREGWFVDKLLLKHAFINKKTENAPYLGAPDMLASQEVYAIKSAYRQLYQIDPYWVKRWKSWECVRCSVADPVSGFQLPSPVWTDYCIIPKVRLPEIAKRKDLHAKAAYNVLADRDDADREHSSTLATIQVVDQELGIFRVVFPPLLDAVIQEIVPFAVDPLPGIAGNISPTFWGQAKPRESHVLETVITAVPALDKNLKSTDDQFLKISVVSAKKSKGPEIEYLSNLEVARYPLALGISDHAQSGVDKATAERAIALDMPINSQYLLPLATGESDQIFWSYKDRWAGIAEYAGCDPDKLKLFPGCQSITIQFSPTNGLSTRYDCMQPQTPEIGTILPKKVREYLYRQIPKTQ